MRKVAYLLIALLLVTGCGEKAKKPIEQPKCNSITGGAYTLNFVTNTETTLDSKAVCIACAPDSYDELPVVEGSEGWYYDAEFTQKVEGTKTSDVKPVAIYDAKDKNCIVGYKNITLYAKIG